MNKKTLLIIGAIVAAFLFFKRSGQAQASTTDVTAAPDSGTSPDYQMHALPYFPPAPVNPPPAGILAPVPVAPAAPATVAAQIQATPAGQPIDPALLAKQGIYANHPVSQAEYGMLTAGPSYNPGDSRIVAGDVQIYDPQYDGSGNLVAAWHSPGTVWSWTAHAWVPG